MPKRIGDLTGQKFGRLTVVRFYGQDKYKKFTWMCECDCGNTSIVSGSELINGRILSCGCLRKERIIEAKTTHGMSHSEVYAEYRNMKNRCYNEQAHNYKYYGGRGIKMCDRWRDDIREFYNDVSSLPNFREKGYTLDRINNDGNYEPGNVRWATASEQMINRRPVTRTLIYEYGGKMRTLKEISNIIGISYKTLSYRIRDLGWDPETAFNTPIQEKYRHKN